MFGYWFNVQREVRKKGSDGGRFKGLKREREREREGGLVN
jgi:hypothetical protein